MMALLLGLLLSLFGDDGQLTAWGTMYREQ